MTDRAVREAMSEDLPRLIALIARMFDHLGVVDRAPGRNVEVVGALVVRLGQDVAAYVTVDGNRPVAVAVGVPDRRLPSPRRLPGRIGYVEWLATDPHYRRRGAARLALEELLGWFDDHDIETIDVHASPDASPLYLELGFAVPHATPLRRRRPERRSDAEDLKPERPLAGLASRISGFTKTGVGWAPQGKDLIYHTILVTNQTSTLSVCQPQPSNEY